MVDQRGRQLLAGLFHQRHQLLLPQQLGVAYFAAEKADRTKDQQNQQAHHDDAEHGHHQHPRAIAGQPPAQQRAIDCTNSYTSNPASKAGNKCRTITSNRPAAAST